jgi:hypothetical protein
MNLLKGSTNDAEKQLIYILSNETIDYEFQSFGNIVLSLKDLKCLLKNTPITCKVGFIFYYLFNNVIF